MPTFQVTVEKKLLVFGVIAVEAANGKAAQEAVEKMMSNLSEPLQTADRRIEWDEPEYDDGSFEVTGDVDRDDSDEDEEYDEDGFGKETGLDARGFDRDGTRKAYP